MRWIFFYVCGRGSQADINAILSLKMESVILPAKVKTALTYYSIFCSDERRSPDEVGHFADFLEESIIFPQHFAHQNPALC